MNAEQNGIGAKIIVLIEASNYLLPIAGAFIVAKMLEARALPKTSETDEFLLNKTKNVSFSEAMGTFDFQLLCVCLVILIGLPKMMLDNA